MEKIIINTDGAARGNPGPAAASFVIRKGSGEVLAKEGVLLGETTNNVAEYMAVKIAFDKIVQDFSGILPANVEVLSDSKLIVEQLSGNFKIKNANLRVLFNEVKQLEQKIGQIVYRHIPRTENYQADMLANLALDESS
ncbi:hypothetical protein A3A14_02895 [Candidatus Daviesbacteria bacterium RIFCSPLOWO2_01_FULL_43_38]|uniref:RNase H type-1 domain-containing protein n=2 Tax=Candidatus Daviesiibacteriota TaxID=1752718 RepID=A0A1F5K3F1_9BACT|nr:MAG: Ribonuclease HI [Candidatus Daviesbacteria bacterium GW2011_GWA1_42_6]OGE19551.1 MAG: hypothetical protein A2874_03480 [Candidatus Daviesbacteria bacterium RIFCSPHIGHO2_01_FULL_43_17]OGE35231.1 MAG: hypothetical protein A3E45_03615 [Candidatus Daviesbacteria bacterium RIFCSPHIGHO2_12_FULL_43_11]OGE63576.1 MAG: hypothetical protein A3A14_02895 [Candidatus Daviesbacteria bacterium RIFCSPLOWO2_01_FULL_43_38]OGE69195.1 MAG: hypothetical protein A3J21_01580 [Candidatus Daviesbacteria bacteri